jgi:hypothetical protein
MNCQSWIRLNHLPGVAGQVVLVQNAKFTVRCFDPSTDPHTPPAGATNSRNYPELSYMSGTLQQQWHITPERKVNDQGCVVQK